MRTLPRSILALVLGTALLMASACSRGNSGGPAANTAREEAEAIKLAKEREKGDRLKYGESKEVITPFGSVIVSKDQSGTVSYKGK